LASFLFFIESFKKELISLNNMEIDFKELKTELKLIGLEEISRVPYRDRVYWVDPMAFPDGKPSQWFESTAYSGADVYVWGGLRQEFKKPLILHEIIEADLVLHQEIERRDAHTEAEKFDGKYAKSLLSKEEFSDYEKTRERFEKAFGKK